MEPDAVQKQNEPFECRFILFRCSLGSLYSFRHRGNLEILIRPC